MGLKALLKKMPEGGLQGDTLREAAAGDFIDIVALVRDELGDKLSAASGDGEKPFIDIQAMFADNVVIRKDNRLYSYPYIITDKNECELGEPVEVVKAFAQVNGADVMQPQMGADAAFAEAQGDAAGTVWEVRIIEAGLSGNGVFYPDAVLREAAPSFDGVPVFAKADKEHVAGEGKDVNKLIGWISAPRFIEARGKAAAYIAGTLNILASETRLREALTDAFKRGKKDLVGLSIDALGKANMQRRDGRVVRMAEAITKVHSVDLIVEPGAGGRLIRLIESINPEEDNDMALRETMLRLLEAQRPDLYRKIDVQNITDESLEATFREAMTPQKNSGEVSREELTETIRMVEARSHAKTSIAASGLPEKAKEKLGKQFGPEVQFTEAQVDAAISEERDYLAHFVESGRVDMGGMRVEAGADRADKVSDMLDGLFDRSRPAQSFREAYVDITGDRGITGHFNNVDKARLREALGTEFREAIDSTTFSNVLGNTITRAMVREYGAMEDYEDFRDLVDIVPIRDFRTQERTRVGGYGNLPAVAQSAPYAALTSPGDEKATYAISKRGGTESITLETIANDDVGLIRRIPLNLARSAKRTLYEFVLDFLNTNPNIYDGTALFTVGHGNLGTAAMDATSFAARRLAMKQRAELSSSKRLGITARHLYVPGDLEEAAYNLFVRTTNLDESFVQSRKPKVHVVDSWTDANNWYLTADKMDVPLIELGFFNGNEEPELFVQDNPTVGSMFSNDKLTYKIRHIYGGNVEDFRGFDGNVVA